MRIALDLQACQTASRHRGIGRYTLDLTGALLSGGQGVDYSIGLDGTYPREANEVMAALDGRLSRDKWSRYYYAGPTQPHGHPADCLRPAAEVLCMNHYAGLAPDIVHANSLFEGFVEHAGGVAGLAQVPGAISSVTVYDFIPLVFSEQYLDNASYRSWYQARLQALQRFDVMLCISEATRRDAMRLLGIPAERLAVIHAGVGSEFTAKALGAAERENLLKRFGISGRFVIYTGNGDFRKNLIGAVDAFARIAPSERNGVQLVLNQVGDEQALRAFAQHAGLSANDLVITGKVSDADLVGLFRSCEAFFFPSLYEGFGLPVLEAMACGAPTICADNSSLGEVMARKDATFDASDAEGAARLLGRALNDQQYRGELREFGIKRAAEYTWDRSAALCEQAWREAMERKAKALRGPRMGQGVRQRIAMVTPLPPQKSGIADYVAELLTPLSRYVDIDLYTDADLAETGDLRFRYRIHHWRDLERSAGRYAHIVYQFGNSPFHMHMVELLRKHPGLVVLHDVYLSSMFWYMESHGGYPDAFRKALLTSHGRSALEVLRAQGPLEARMQFPASLGVIEGAAGILVHSAHSAEVVDSFYPGASRAMITRAPMPLRLPEDVGQEGKSLARTELGITPAEQMIVSFGFMADTKLNHLLLDAVACLPAERRADVRLVFVGGGDGGEYGERIQRRIQQLGNDVRVEITGFVAEDTYRRYLVAADVAVQLRAESRGETSKAVYDCMAYGVPTIVNDYAGFRELSPLGVRKVSAQPSISELADALSLLLSSEAACRSLGTGARGEIRRHHDPDLTARTYMDALWSSGQTVKVRNGSLLANCLADVFEEASPTDREYHALETSVASTLQARGTPRLFLDLSEVVHSDYGTGVHRVVRNLARECLLGEQATRFVVHPVAHVADGTMVSAESFTRDVLGVPDAGRSPVSDMRAGDVLFLLDSAWDKTERFEHSIANAHRAGARVGAMVYDLIPLRHPQHCVDFMPAVFEQWLRYVVLNCDVLVCISRAVADDLQAWIREVAPEQRSGQRIGHVHLGSDLVEQGAKAEPSRVVRNAFAKPAVLMVGTVEPRKGHGLALDAFELAWKRGSSMVLVIIGKKGWNVEALASRLRDHPEAGKRLLWLEKVSDADLEHAYASAVALLQASSAEGFGLPIVEAARHGVPLLLSDIPVFREVAREHAAYFTLDGPESLARLLVSSLPPAAPVDLGLTWSESASKFMRLLLNGGWDY